LFATLVTAVTLGLRLALAGQLGGRPTLIVFIVPIMLSAYVGGLRAGLLATALTYLSATYYLLPPIHSFRVASAVDRWDLFFCMLAGLVVSVLNETLHRARRRADVANAAREQAEADRERFFTLSQAVFCTLGFDGYFKELNPAWEKTLGYTKAELLATPFIEFVHPDDRQATLAEAQQVCGGKSLTAFENRYRRKDGSYRWFEWSVTPIIEDQVMYGVARDITEGKKAEDQLRASFKEIGDLKTALDEHAIVAITDPQGKISYVNDKFCAISKYSREELLGQDHRIINSDFHPKEFIRELWTTIARGKVWKGEIKNKAKDGSFYWVDTTIVPFLDEQGKPRQYVAVRADITERKRAEDQLKASFKEIGDLKTALDEHAIVAITDPKGKITYVNDKFCAISKYSREELLGQDHRIINSGFHPKEFIRTIWRTIGDGRVWKGEIKNKAKDGSFYWVDTTIVPFLDDQGKPRQYVAVRADITERKTFERALQQTNVELESAKSVAEKANRAKSDFLSSMSHELRSPLNAILGFAQLMESASPAPTASQAGRIAQILQAGWYLLKLINEILDLAVIESGQLSLSKESVSLSEVLSECRSMLEPEAQQRGISMIFPRFDKPVFVSADRTRLKQIIINLVSNAIKYNKENGTVVVDCAVSDPERIRISVKDTGAGLPPEKLAQLFTPFNRLGQENSSVAGTGIGLVVSKRLVELMDGVIGVESTVGVGSVFWCELSPAKAPQLEVRNGETGAPVQPEVPADTRLRTLLYVEDNPANMKLVEELIARSPDIRLETAVSGTLGIELARAVLPQVILMDINLPGISGVKVLRILRDDPATAHIPVIALSANAMPRDIEKGLEAGFFRYLTKPIKIGEFMDTLNAALEFAEKRPAGALEAAVVS
jgi:PAS domain S-box-containing protein